MATQITPKPVKPETNTQDGIAVSGYDVVGYFANGAPTKGSDCHQVHHGDAVYFFASAAHKNAFVENPEQYLPQYGGYCAFGVASGYKASIDPSAFTLEDGKLYLNHNAAVQQDWRQDLSGNIRTADGTWPTVRAR